MASDLIPSVGLLLELEGFRAADLEGASLGLFEGSHVPNIADTLATYTAIETAFGGYAEQVLTGWSTSAMAGTVAQTVSPFATFSPNGAPGSHTITGYFLYNGTTVLGAGRLAGSIAVAASTPFALVVKRTLSN